MNNFFMGMIMSVLIILSFTGAAPQPGFYVATDKSFGDREIPSINLEGPGGREYEFRVYQITNPVDFLLKQVKQRLVTEKNEGAYGNAVVIFKQGLQYFKKDFRKTARKEFNYKTRSQARKALGVDLDSRDTVYDPVVASLISDHRFVFSFSIPRQKEQWNYRKIKVPVRDNGVYLVEVVSGREMGYTLVVKSGLNFLTKQSDSQTLVWVARRDTGEPVKGASINIYNGENGSLIREDKTSSDGIGRFDGRSIPHTLLIVRKDGEYGISDPDFFARSFYGEGGIRVYMYTERPVYRPGDTVYFRGVVRNFRGDYYRPAGGGAGVTVKDGSGAVIVQDVPVQVDPGMGTFDGKVTLPDREDIYLGRYNLLLSYNGGRHSCEFAVEAYRKPAFVVKVSTPRNIYCGGDTVDVNVSARYYFGNPVEGGQVECRVFRRKKYDFSPVGSVPFFSNVSEYLGMNRDSRNELVLEKKGRLASDGSFTFSVKTDEMDDDYTYSAVSSVTADDSSISGSSSFSVNRSEIFVRIVKDNSVVTPGDNSTFIIELVPQARGLGPEATAALTGNRKIKATLYTRSFTGISQESDRNSVASANAFTDMQGRARLVFPIKSRGHYILEVAAKDTAGRETVTSTAFWASAQADSLDVPYKNLTLKASKDIYRIGEQAEILIMTPAPDGTLFISTEGDRIYDYKTVKMKGNTYKYRIPVRREMSPNFTVSVNQFANNYAYQSQIKIVAPPLDRFISVNLAPGRAEYKPGDEATVVIRTLDDKNRGVPAEVSVAVVDEAVYQIMENTTPAITTFFYQPRQNNVMTTFFNAYKFFGYSEFRRLQLALRAKGNLPLCVLKEDDSRLRDRFKDTCFWNARVRTDRNGRAVVRFPLAENITTWRVSAVAVTADTKVGQAGTTFMSRKKMMILSGLPSYMIRGNSHYVSANISNMTDREMKVDITATASGGTVRGASTSSVIVGPGKTSGAYFQVIPSADDAIDACAIRFEARGGGYTDRVESKVPLRHFGMNDMTSAYVYLTNDGESSGEFTMPGKYINPRLTLRFSNGNGDVLRQSLDYLVNYPYGCIEQTMSRFMPVLAANETGYCPRDRNWDLHAMMKKGLLLISQNQRNDGGFGWFGENGSDIMMTAYVYRGLALCKAKFRADDMYMMPRARWFLYSCLEKGKLTVFERIYILSCLSEGSRVEKSMLDGVLKSYGDLTAYGKSLAVQLLYNTGSTESAGKLFEDALNASRFMKDDSMYFGSDELWEDDKVETAASLLVSSVRLSKEKKIQDRLALVLSANRKGIAWKNSRDTAMAVLALAEYLKNRAENGEPSLVKVMINGKGVCEANVSPAISGEGYTVFRIPSAPLSPGKNTLKVVKKGGSSLHVTAMVDHVNRSDSFAEKNRGISLKRNYYRINAERKGNSMELNHEWSADFIPGDLVMVQLDVERKDGDYPYVMVTDPVPPGFSFVMKDGEYYSKKYPREYLQRMVYDDRAVFFFNRNGGGTSIRYFLRAEIPGKYRALPSSASLMYYPDITGSTSDCVVTIGNREAK